MEGWLDIESLFSIAIVFTQAGCLLIQFVMMWILDEPAMTSKPSGPTYMPTLPTLHAGRLRFQGWQSGIPP
jgi:hypothetical protein